MVEEKSGWTKPVAAGVVVGLVTLGGTALIGDDNAADNTAVLNAVSVVDAKLAALETSEQEQGLTKAQVKEVVVEALSEQVITVESVDHVLDHEDRAIAIAIEEIEDEVEDLFDFLNDRHRIEIDDEDDVEILDYRDWDVDIENRRDQDYDVEGQVKVRYLNEVTGDERTRWIDFELTIEDGKVKGRIDYDF